ncbi:MAG: glycosyltransferase family 2 protein [Candidatus Methylomirabilales bacterium]
MARVSVVIPTYNRGDTLPETLQSVFAQTYRDYEVIVVDDGSTDDTPAVMDPFRDRVHYIYQPNAGQARARNHGVRSARGEFIALLDSDDAWEPELLETEVGVLDRLPEVVLVSARSTTAGKASEEFPRTQDVFWGDLFLKLFQGNFINTSAVVVRRTCLEAAGGFNERYRCYEDYDLWLRIARWYPVAYVSRSLVRCGRQGDNVSKDRTRPREIILEILNSHYDPVRIPDAVYRRRVSNCCLALGRISLNQGDPHLAWEYFRRSRALTPFSLRPYRYLLRGLLKGSGVAGQG